MGKESLEDVSKSVNRLEQKYALLPEFMRAKGLVRQQIASFNFFTDVDMQKIVKAASTLRSEMDSEFFLKFSNIRIEAPTAPEDAHNTTEISPMECRTRSMTYAGPIKVDIKYNIPDASASQRRRGQQRGVVNREIREERGVEIGRMPIMLQSRSCRLRGKSPWELAKMKECPFDPGGYFVVRGGEKVVLIQEQLSNNRVLIEHDDKGFVSAAVTSSTHERKSRSKLIQKKGRFYLKSNIFTKEVPIAVVLKAMGVSSDQEIVTLAGPEAFIHEAMQPSLEEAMELQLFTRNQALEFVGRQVQSHKGRFLTRRKDPIEEGRDVLAAVVIPHIPVRGYNFKDKALFIGFMIRRVILASTDSGWLSDKDYYGNKRLELAGHLMSLLFEDLFKQMLSRVKTNVEKRLSKGNADLGDIAMLVRQNADILTNGLSTAIASGNWSLQRFRMDKKGITETVSRLSYIACLGHMTRIRSHVEKTRKISGPRALQPSQWGLICPSDTPEGEQCGLVKSLALLTHVTSDEESAPLVELLFTLGTEDVAALSGAEIYSLTAFLVLVNGAIIGVHRSPTRLVAALRAMRRRGLVGEFVSLCTDRRERCVHIATDGGRVCRPLVICDPVTGRTRMRPAHLQQLIAGLRDHSSFVKEGLIEYVDANEENECLVALSEEDLRPGVTHMEIDPMTILGVVSGLIPYPHHNQSPRNTYQCAMGKQAIGSIGLNQGERVDISPLNLLAYPMRPLVHSRVLEMVHFNQLGAGQNAMVAVMSYSGYDIEDAVVLNRSSLDRGYGRVIIYKRYKIVLRQYPNRTVDSLRGPPRRADNATLSDRQWEKMTEPLRVLGADGLAEPGRPIRAGDVMANRHSPLVTTEATDLNSVPMRSAPERYKEPGIAHVDRVMLTSNETDKYVIKVVIRDVRRPELGDKFSSRHGQKGVVGLIVPQEDLPFNDLGMCPDMIMNPHGFPSRMTVGKMIELMSGKAGLLDGKFRYGSAFSGDSVQSASEVLIKHGFNYAGKDLLTSGLTGETLQSYVFMGPIYYQRLKHMVKDKMFARARGPTMVLTRQPTQGRARSGGLRVGEMERDCLVAHGTSLLLVERLLVSSDPFMTSVCNACGYQATPGWCQYCRSPRSVRQVRIPYACKLLFQELQAMNIRPRLHLEEGGYFDQSSVSAQPQS